MTIERSNFTATPDDGNSDEFQKWSALLPAGLSLTSDVEVRVWAMRSDGSAGDGAIYVHLLDCDAAGSSCLPPIASGSTLKAIGSTFEEFVIPLGNPAYVIAPGRTIVVRLGAQNLPTTKPMIVAYGTASYPSAFHIL